MQATSEMLETINLELKPSFKGTGVKASTLLKAGEAAALQKSADWLVLKVEGKTFASKFDEKVHPEASVVRTESGQALILPMVKGG